jgi:hypothetical protein
MSSDPPPDRERLVELFELAQKGDNEARGELKRWLDDLPSDPPPTTRQLVALFELTQDGDPEARCRLEAWFRECSATMRGVREARRDMGEVAYLAAEAKAERDLKRFHGITRDKESVASRVYLRAQPFLDEVDNGVPKTVDDFIGLVSSLERFILLDLAKLRDKQQAHEEPMIEDNLEDEPVEPALTAEGQLRKFKEDHDQLRHIYRVVPADLFILVLLVGYCDLKLARVADMIDSTAHLVKQDLLRAARMIGESLPEDS